MELELLTKDDAEAKPAGRARDEPNMNPHLNPPELVLLVTSYKNVTMLQITMFFYSFVTW